jgi:hypothetical protein
MTVNSVSYTYCYDMADRLTSTTQSGVGTLTYDGRGNTTTIGGMTLSYDGSNRHMSTVDGSKTVTHIRDVTDRIVQRAANGETTRRYAHTGPTDAATAVLTTAGSVVERVIPLIGGGTYASSSMVRHSLPNIHGGTSSPVTATNGERVGGTHHWTPFGEPLGNHPGTMGTTGSFEHGWVGEHHKKTETATQEMEIHCGSSTHRWVPAHPGAAEVSLRHPYKTDGLW